MQQWQQAITENIPFYLEYRFLHHDGTIRWVIGEAIAETDENDRIVGYIGTITDISDRKQAEIALQESEARFRSIAETIEDVFWVSIPWERHILYLSPAYERIWGRTRESAYTDYQSWFESLHPDDRERTLAIFASQIETGNFDADYRIIRSDGSIRWIHDRGYSIVDESGNLQRVVGIAEDISDRKQAELQLKTQTAQLEQSNATLIETTAQLTKSNQDLERFVYIASHDLKAPLRAISSLSTWLEEDLQGQLSQESQRHLELLRGRVYRLDALLDGLLAYSRVGRHSVPTEMTDVGQLLSEVINSLAPPASFTIKISTSMPTFITKRMLLAQVFSHLISNAIKHHPRSHGQIEISAFDKGKYYEFAVTDDGSGIALEYREKIFVIFQTLKARDVQENTGIGLSIVKKILETEGGEIFVESDLGKGTTFRFTWPLQ
jgi:PAS domain S-box-containing protein